MLRKDKALLESLTKKYGKRNLINEVSKETGDKYGIYENVVIDNIEVNEQNKEVSFWYDSMDFEEQQYKTIKKWKKLEYSYEYATLWVEY